ncbi:MAG TPA: CpaF family protein [Bryobacteraceae bacterium]|nr:CpaF family protein [Bryobacteraceae bacterium]
MAEERPPVLPVTDHLHLKTILHRKLAERVNPASISPMAGERDKGDLLRIIQGLVRAECGSMGPSVIEQVAEEILTETLGLGPLEPLLQDPTVSDILVTTPKMVHVERAGKLYESLVEFKDDAHLIQVIERIVSRVGRRIDATSPLVDARLPDGSRVNAVIPPVAVDGPLLSIRRFGNDRLPAAALVQNLTLTQGMLDFLQACVRARLNVIISGGTGAGKTTLLNVLSAFIDGGERIVTIEDAAELQLRQRHVARLESRPANSDGEGAVRIRQLVVNALRMRPDRIIVGEVRGEEALDMLQAMNTGHDGSLTTIHANSPRDAAARLEVMVGMANANMPVRAVRQQMSSAIDLFVQISRMSDGTRRVTYLTECCGMEGDLVTTQDIFVFERTGLGEDGRVKGRFKPTGIRPRFSDRIKALGVELSPSLFQTVVEIR